MALLIKSNSLSKVSAIRDQYTRVCSQFTLDNAATKNMHGRLESNLTNIFWRNADE
jgi:hypothetical protein